MNIVFKKEKLQDVWDEMLPILKEHYLEIAHYKDIRFEPNVAEYFRMEDAGITHTFTARENGELIGYAVFNIRYNLHYKSSKQAYQDVIYISKEKRGFGKSFIKWCDDELRKLGVQVVNQHIKFAHDWSIVLERLGYEKQDIQLSRRLDK